MGLLGGDGVLGRVNLSRSVHNDVNVPDAGRAAEVVADADEGYARPAGKYYSPWTGMTRACDYGMRYHQTGERVFGEIARELTLHYIDIAERENDWKLTGYGYGDPYFWPWRFAMAWDLIEEGDVFSDGDRLRITNMVLQTARWVADLGYFSMEGSPEGMIRQNHCTFAALSLNLCAGYLKKYYGIREFDGRLRDVERVFRGQATSSRSNDDAGFGYCWLVPRHILQYFLERGETDYMEKGFLRAMGDFAILTTDNRRDECTYGDVGTYARGFGWSRAYSVLLKAAWFHDDGRYRWAYDWLTAGKPTDTLDSWFDGAYHRRVTPVEPKDLLGIAVARMDEGMYRWVLKNSYGPFAPREAAFDKMSFRKDFDPNGEYMLIEGSSTFAHGHEDGNSIARLTWDDRLWLADLHYIRKYPKHHNGVFIIRDGVSTQVPTLAEVDRGEPLIPLSNSSPGSRIPALASLDLRADFADAGFTRTSVAPYAGARWGRNVAWKKGRFFLVIDEVTALQSGDYHLQCFWRGLGDVRLDGEDMILSQGGVSFQVRSGDGSSKETLEEGPTFLHNWKNYEYSPDGVVKIVSQRQHLYMAEGQRAFYFNLLTPQKEAGLKIQRVGESVVKIVAGRGSRVMGPKTKGRRQTADGRRQSFEALIGVGDGRCRVGGLEVDAGLFCVERDAVSFVGMRRVKAGRFAMVSSVSISIHLDFRTGEGTVVADGPAEVRMSAQRVALNGRAAGRKGKDGLISFSVAGGTHRLKVTGLKGDAFRQALDRRYTGYVDARLRRRPALARKGMKAVWAFRGEGGIRSIFAGDVDGDGCAEVVAGSGAGDVHLLGSDGKERWRQRAEGAVNSVHAFRGTGRRMSVVAGSEDCGVYLFDAAGRRRWVFRRGRHHGRDSRVVAVSAADLNGDERTAVLAGTESWQLYAIDLDGSLRWQADMCHHSVTNLLPEDFDGDGRTEIAVGTEYYNCDFVNPDGTIRWLYRITTPEFTAVAAADVNGDGVKEALFGTMDGTLHALPPTVSEYRAISTPPYRMGYAEAVWKVNLGDEPSGVVVTDVDGDGEKEIVAASMGGNLYIIDLSGRKRARRDLMRPLTALTALNGGEVAVGTADGGVLVCDGRGEVARSCALQGGVTALRAVDVDGDGAEEVVAATTRGQVAGLR
ncbi:MAG: hypothetical protein A3F84_18230 [Candidatus Handelsmanbacteria bacterium RIFCSPLOWO2_12_FULL_64_10]|uniref:Pyrrolo-quinoline quinone repeat domain-containing protein n=1 Tax=Handelsmanbacteria sp. (strain RIFCSPLOWO2_12_FULL_64_10) TaxID=1817868 RepID=A0A1F6CC34_HANXR|nr:MAG: hypothetical protein A3F84_18230 [Candidatus Handelsmanbacteria bacterium RIFCSPLOWO2_12_FULL_64_10]